jgi:hypothetical protein
MPGMRFHRTDVLRMAMHRGVEEMEAEAAATDGKKR